MNGVGGIVYSLAEFSRRPQDFRMDVLEAILAYPETEIAMGSLGFVFNSLTQEEKELIGETLGNSSFSTDFHPNEKVVSRFLERAFASCTPSQSEKLFRMLGENWDSLQQKPQMAVFMLLGEPDEEIRNQCAEFFNFLETEKPEIPEGFVNAFYLGDAQAGKELAAKLTDPREASTFAYLCLALSKQGEKEKETAQELLSFLVTATGKNDLCFYDIAHKARALFLVREKRREITKEEYESLKSSTERFLFSAKADSPDSRIPTPFSKKPSRPPKRTSSSPPQPVNQ